MTLKLNDNHCKKVNDWPLLLISNNNTITIMQRSVFQPFGLFHVSLLAGKTALQVQRIQKLNPIPLV